MAKKKKEYAKGIQEMLRDRRTKRTQSRKAKILKSKSKRILEDMVEGVTAAVSPDDPDYNYIREDAKDYYRKASVKEAEADERKRRPKIQKSKLEALKKRKGFKGFSKAVGKGVRMLGPIGALAGIPAVGEGSERTPRMENRAGALREYERDKVRKKARRK